MHAHNAPASLMLSSFPLAAVLTVRLEGGLSWRSGRLEVFHNGTWGSVCRFGFSQRDAQVVCRHLGVNAVADIRPPRAKFGLPPPDSPVWLTGTNIRCTGAETRLQQCVRGNVWGNTGQYCTHDNDVALRCRPLPLAASPGPPGAPPRPR